METAEQKATAEAKELVDVYVDLFTRHDHQITYTPQPTIAYRNAKEAATIAINKMLAVAVLDDVQIGEGEDVELMGGRTYYNLVLKAIEKL